MREVVVLGAKRSAIAAFGGSLASVSPVEIAVPVIESLIGNLPSKEDVDELILGNVLGAGHGMNLARQVCLKSGLPIETPAYSINKVCGSGLKAINLAAQSIATGESEVVLAGGSESMSQAGHISMQQRWGQKLGHAELQDLLLRDGLTDAFADCHMGITAENLAERYDLSREAQDSFAAKSQEKAAAAIAAGHFFDEIVPIPLMKRGKQIGTFETDEHPRPETTCETLANLRPAFKKDGTVTAGNASGINDGSAFLMLSSKEYCSKHGLEPLATLSQWARAAVEPEVMGIGPVRAVQSLLERADLALSDIDLIESNEAFAAQALAVDKLLEWDSTKVNVNGGAIALGHPIGASGARIAVTLLHEMRRRNSACGIATLCVGGGQGVASLFRMG